MSLTSLTGNKRYSNSLPRFSSSYIRLLLLIILWARPVPEGELIDYILLPFVDLASWVPQLLKLRKGKGSPAVPLTVRNSAAIKWNENGKGLWKGCDAIKEVLQGVSCHRFGAKIELILLLTFWMQNSKERIKIQPKLVCQRSTSAQMVPVLPNISNLCCC